MWFQTALTWFGILLSTKWFRYLYIYFGLEAFFSTEAGKWVATDVIIEPVINKVDTLIGLAVKPALELSGHILERITGVASIGAAVSAWASGPPSRTTSAGIGGAFMLLVEDIFNVGAAAADHVNRTRSEGGTGNLNAFFGTNMLFQLRSLAIGTIASLAPIPGLRHLEGLHQSINWAFGFGWLSWAVMSEYMNVTTMPAIRRKLNRAVKPNDLTAHQAYQAFLEDRLELGTFHQILDNYGERSDIRDLTLDMQEPDLTETDARDLLQRGAWHDGDVEEYYRRKGYRPVRRGLKTHLTTGDRSWHIDSQALEWRAKLFRDGVISEGELRVDLKRLFYTQLEEDLYIDRVKWERAQRRFLSLAQMKKALADKELTNAEVLQDLSYQGFTTRDAGIILQDLLGTKAKLPKIPQFTVTPGVVAPGGGIVIQWTTTDADKIILHIQPKTGAPSDLVLQAQGTLNQVISQDTSYRLSASNKVGEISKADAVQVRFPRPTASLSVSPGVITIGLLPTEVEVKWSTANATKVTITPGLGVVPPDGARIVTLNADTVFTLIAEGPGGTETVQDTVIARPAGIALPHVVVGPPKVTLTVSPGVIEQGQDVAVQWSIQDATEATLYPLNEKISGTGAKILQVNAETIFRITAKNAFGETTKTDAVTFKGAATTPGDTGPAAPWGYFYASRSEVKAGERVVLTWHVENAATVTITPGIGTVELVGTRIVVVSKDTIFEIKATGPGGEWKYQQAVLTNP